MDSMHYPDFFAQIPRLKVRDPLAAFLGVGALGELEYGYLDAVKLAGHSCPTVASAYWLTCRALGMLYGQELPVRGAVRVSLREERETGVAGVMGAVAGLLTGAAGPEGFKGLAGQQVRRNLLLFGVDLPLDLRFERLDTGARVEAAAHPRRVPVDPDMPALMQDCLAGVADAAQQQRFGQLWQARVWALLSEYRDDPQVFELRWG